MTSLPPIVVARAQTGDRAALDAVLRELQAPLWAHVRGIVRDDETAADVLQDVLLTVCRKLSTLRDPRWLRAWAYRIATRAAVRRAHAERSWREALRGEDATAAVDASAALDTVEETAFDASLVAAVPTLVETLSPAARAVVRMHYLDGLSLVEIAEALEVPLGTVKSRLAYGLTAMRAHVRRSLTGAPDAPA